MLKEAESILRELNLTKYEAKAYLVLLTRGSCTAEEISSFGGIPLPRVYDTMQELAEKGLVLVSKTRPQKFSAVSPEKLFKIIKDEEKRKTEERIKSVEKFEKKFLSIMKNLPKDIKPEEREIVTYVKRKINIGSALKEIEKETKKEFLVFAGDLSWADKGIKSMVKRGVDYKILWSNLSKESIKNAKKMAHMGVDIRYSPDISNLRGFVSDGKKVCLIRKKLKSGETKPPKPGEKWTENIGDYTGIIIESKLISDVFRRYFYLLWKFAKPVEKALKKAKV